MLSEQRIRTIIEVKVILRQPSVSWLCCYYRHRHRATGRLINTIECQRFSTTQRNDLHTCKSSSFEGQIWRIIKYSHSLYQILHLRNMIRCRFRPSESLKEFLKRSAEKETLSAACINTTAMRYPSLYYRPYTPPPRQRENSSLFIASFIDMAHNVYFTRQDRRQCEAVHLIPRCKCDEVLLPTFLVVL
jgi:hypothetical protein